LAQNFINLFVGNKKYELRKPQERKEAFMLINGLSMFKDFPPERTNFHSLRPEVDKAIRLAWEEWPDSYGDGTRLY